MPKPNLLTGTFITYSDKNTPNSKGSKFQERQITFQLADDESVTGKGRLITPKACHQMVKEKFDDYLSRANSIPKDYVGYVIGKEAILQILAQAGCEGIMVLDCVNDQGESSIVLAGVDRDEKLVKGDRFPIDDSSLYESSINNPTDPPIIIERIGKVSTQGVLNQMQPPPSGEEQNNDKASILMTNKFLGLQ
jgi:hypothetical protein